MINAYFLVNDASSEVPALTFAAAVEVLPREGEVVSFEEGLAYKVLLVHHHLRNAMLIAPGFPGSASAETDAGDDDVPIPRHEASIMVRAVTEQENDFFIRLNESRAAARLAPFFEDAL